MPSLTAEFGVSCSSLDCTFSDASTISGGTITAWQWDFGDGATSTDQNCTHAYTSTEPDTLVVALIVTDNDGGTSTASKNVIVACRRRSPVAVKHATWCSRWRRP